ncbi:MAG: SpoIID/LytB domain-containing protein [Gomphosphaeria aponina SAG 52.96 = DSM 107014]|uniref:SpoIID/LytB domain-containing protein n=1 Tax=Gomphosphaeria aponina SAG 52.96 = DSM 107014 TaxID=1521640 RepID=A0A941GRP5_9CHRO|nr:SpoIID/LytB domain-containing protein [Gomphosphaeria aponina SAG 52.96 = DSM 107014]
MYIKHSLFLLAGRNWGLALVIWLFSLSPVQAAIELRVAIAKNVNQLIVGSTTTAIVTDASGKELGEIPAMNSFIAQPGGGGISLGKMQSGQLLIAPEADGYVWIGDRWYRGSLKIMREGSGFIAINYVELEDYLYSVVGSEAVPSWPKEALKAQAVASRTYALYKHSTARSVLYDLDATQMSQVYKGVGNEYVRTHEAVNATQGEIMTYEGKAILAVFHSSSGGHTENVEDVWTSPLPYLRGVIDYDQTAPVFQWTKTFSGGELGNLIGGVGRVKEMIPEATTPFGRVVTMKVVGDRGAKLVKGTHLRQLLGLRSTLFSVSQQGDNFQVSGRGFGHGLGLSQWGAYYMATQGYNYKQILTHYYQNIIFSKMEEKLVQVFTQDLIE